MGDNINLKINKNILIIIAVCLAAAGFIWAMNEKDKRAKAEEALKQKNDDYLKLLSEYLNKRNDLPDELKTQLLHLREEYDGINDAVALKLEQVIKLITAGEQKLAIEKLSLIIENLLKDKYIKEGKAKDKKSCPTLHKLLHYAKDLKWITEHQFNFSLFVKENRNESVHNIDENITSNAILISFLAGIEIIYHLKGLKAEK